MERKGVKRGNKDNNNEKSPNKRQKKNQRPNGDEGNATSSTNAAPENDGLQQLQVQTEAMSLLRYESSTLILYKELSSPIFQSCLSVSQSGIGNTCPDLHFVQYIKA